MTSGPGVLWIGRMLFATDLRIREVELARRISQHRRVYALDRSDVLGSASRSLAGRIGLRWRLLMTDTRVLSEGVLTRFRMPVWAATGPLFNRAAAALNQRRVESMTRQFGCDSVYLSKPFFFLPEKPGRRSYRVHFDLIDNFHDEWTDRTVLGRSRRAFLRENLLRADTLSACSLSLCDRVREISGRQAAYAPNGAARQELLASSEASVQKVRDDRGLGGRFVVGTIGNHEVPFDGLDMLLDAWPRAFSNRPELALMIVGRGSGRLAAERGLGPEQGVFIVGPVPTSEVASYFRACDVGLMPFRLEPVTHDALPINVVEFSVCGKAVLCNPLKELKRLAWPNLRFVEPNAAAWTEALSKCSRYSPGDPAELARLVEICDWDKSAEVIRAQMEEA